MITDTSHISAVSSFLDKRILNRLTQSLETLNRHRPFSQSVLKKIQNQLSIEMTYHSNAIEGNRLTLKETMLVLKEGVTVKGKNLQDHLEAKNHAEAMEFLFEFVDLKQSITLSHHLIRQLHQLVVKDTEESIAGKYRHTDVQILGSRHKPPAGFKVQEEMSSFLKWITSNSKKVHPVELAALAHHRFVLIHPFEDGNGRTGRLLMNLLLIRAGYPLAIIQKNDRSKYYRALDAGDRGGFEGIVRMIAQAVERSLKIYEAALLGSTKKTEWLTLSDLARKTEYSAKYLNLLIRKGLLTGRKEGRNWFSHLHAVEEYKQSRLRNR